MNNQRYRALAQYLRDRLEATNQSAYSASQSMGFSETYLNNILLGQYRPSEKRAVKIAKYFGDDPNIILELAGYYVPPSDRTKERAEEYAASLGGLDHDLQDDAVDYVHYLRWKQARRNRSSS